MVANVYIYSYSISGSTYAKAEEELTSYYEGLGYKVIRGQYPTGLGSVTLPASVSLLLKVVSVAVKLGRPIATIVSQGLRQWSIKQIIGGRDRTHGFIHIQSIPMVSDESQHISMVYVVTRTRFVQLLGLPKFIVNFRMRTTAKIFILLLRSARF